MITPFACRGDNCGSSVERTATLHPLWRMLGWWPDAVWNKVEHCVVGDLKRQPGMGLVSRREALDVTDRSRRAQ
jgi:hypothetical protein